MAVKRSAVIPGIEVVYDDSAETVTLWVQGKAVLVLQADAITLKRALTQEAAATFEAAVTEEAEPVLPSRTRKIRIPPGAAFLPGSNPPTKTILGTGQGLTFDADNEKCFIECVVPPDWEGDSDLTLSVYWHPESGTAVGDGETVKWDLSYRSLAAGEALDNGTAAAATATETQSGAGTDKALYKTDITIDHDDGDQPLVAGDQVVMQFDRDMTGDTYSADAVVVGWELSYSSVKAA